MRSEFQVRSTSQNNATPQNKFFKKIRLNHKSIGSKAYKPKKKIKNQAGLTVHTKNKSHLQHRGYLLLLVLLEPNSKCTL